MCSVALPSPVSALRCGGRRRALASGLGGGVSRVPRRTAPRSGRQRTPPRPGGSGQGKRLAVRSEATAGDDITPAEGPAEVRLPVGPQGSPVGQMLLHLISSGQGYLVAGAAEPHLRSLATKVEELSGRPQGDVTDTDEISALLGRKVQELREKEARLEVVTALYFCSVGKLQEAGVMPRESLEAGTIHTGPQWQAALGPALADGMVGHLGGLLGGPEANQEAVAHVAAGQLAGLYLGIAEFGYFLRAVKERMAQQGLQLGDDCSALLDYAEALPMEQVRAAAEVRSREALHALRQHVGNLFLLDPEESPELGSPYPDLQALSGSQIAPTAHLLEHFDDSGRAENLAEQAASKADRGWSEAAQRDLQDAGASLPVPTLLQATIKDLRLLMLEAAGLGCALWEAETEIWEVFPLIQREA